MVATGTYSERIGASVASTLGLKHLASHFNTVLISFVAFTAVHLFLAPFFSKRLFPLSFGQAGRRAQNNWSIRVVSLLHALVIIPLAFRALHVPRLAQDKAFGWDDRHGTLAAVACGYFLWDSVESAVHYIDVGFVIHGLACLAIYALSFKPFLAYYGARFLLWELSTPFLNINWFLDKTGKTGSTLQLINGLCLLSTFAGARLIYGGIMSYDFFQTLYAVRNELPTAYLIIYGLGNVVLQGLNWFWFTKMIDALRRRMQPVAKGPVAKVAAGVSSASNATNLSSVKKFT
ncbi:DUF887-domain-containing protein [Punctularia strigosozonata HHB-11173 SS5]|uniref:DUF887-domain-containing protein n=1 Tax=Punctularia strigosozonata (strain HHB-11173) TaxID=741275 RepID=UPI00044182E0|nr:DUF887-domain-containing protein [Punctularia strigosozonata HHB-11173 SS5]EIN07165.1 DUF887-domain-containing protein [Punctularia strigosozonata HHB-11173 SS5]